MSEMRMSPGVPQTLPSVLALLRACDLPETGVREAFDGFMVAQAGDEVVGCCGLEVHGKHGLLRSLAVTPQYRGRGLGERLVHAAIERARREGLSAVYLLTTTARDFFVRLGFETCPRDEAPDAIRASWEFRTGCPSTAAFMRLHT